MATVPASHASSPPVVKTTGSSLVSDPFDPPTRVAFVVGYTSDATNNSGTAPTVTSSAGAAIDWTLVEGRGYTGRTGSDVGLCAVWKGVLVDPDTNLGAMTITVSPGSSATQSKMMIVRVYDETQVDIADPIGAVAFGAFTAGTALTSDAMLPETTGGGLRMLYLDWWATGLPASYEANTELVDAYHAPGLSTNVQLGKQTPTEVGVSESIGVTLSADSADGNWIAYELRASPTPPPDPDPAFDGTAFDGTAFDVPASGSSNPRAVAETLTTGDTSSARVTLARTAAETLATADAAVRTSSRSRATAEGLTTSDTTSRTGSRSRAAAETLTTGDTTAGAVTKTTTRSIAEGLVTGDTTTRAPIAYTRTAGETTSTTDTTSRTSSRARTGAEALVTTDTPVRRISRARTAAETLTTSDTTSRTSSRARAGAEALVLVDTTSRQLQRLRGTAEGLVTSDTTSRVAPAKTRSTTETLTTADTSSASTTGNLSRATAEALVTSDTTSRTSSRARSAGETATTSDVVARRTTAPRLLGEALTLTEGTQRAQAAARATLETLQLVDDNVTTFGLPLVDVVVLAPPVGRQREVLVGISSPRDVDLDSRPPDPTPTSRRRTVTITGRPPEERR